MKQLSLLYGCSCFLNICSPLEGKSLSVRNWRRFLLLNLFAFRVSFLFFLTAIVRLFVCLFILLFVFMLLRGGRNENWNDFLVLLWKLINFTLPQSSKDESVKLPVNYLESCFHIPSFLLFKRPTVIHIFYSFQTVFAYILSFSTILLSFILPFAIYLFITFYCSFCYEFFFIKKCANTLILFSLRKKLKEARNFTSFYGVFR